MNKNYFSNIAGYNELKEELINISKWYYQDADFSAKGIKLPIGFIFHGPTGTGKSKFVSEFIKLFDYPNIYINGEKENSCEEVLNIFNEARKNNCSIIVIDELDLLIEKDRRLVRVLQTEIDKAYEDSNILVFATTNNLYSIPKPLMRCGRLERIYEVKKPNEEERKELIKLFLKNLDIDEKIFDVSYLSKIFVTCSGALIQSIIHDAYLRSNGNLTTDEIEKSLYILQNGIKYKENFDDKNKMIVCMHEVGHAIITYKNKEYFNFYSAYINQNIESKGMCKILPVFENDDSLDMMKAEIEIALGGYVVNKYLNHIQTKGAYEDIIKANKNARLMINILGYKGLKYILKKYNSNERNETEFNCYRNEKLVSKLIIKCEKEVKRYVKKNKAKIFKLANILADKGILTSKDLLNVIEN